MDFKEAMQHSLKTDKHTRTDPFLLYSALCDCARNDYTVSPQAEMFHRFNKTYGLVAEMKKNPKPRMIGNLLDRCREKYPDVREVALEIYILFLSFTTVQIIINEFELLF